MISTKGLKDGDLCFIFLGEIDGEETDPLVKVKARYQNGQFVAEGNGYINGSRCFDGEIYGSSVVKFKRIFCTKHCDYSNNKKECSKTNTPYPWCEEWRREKEDVKKE